MASDVFMPAIAAALPRPATAPAHSSGNANSSAGSQGGSGSPRAHGSPRPSSPPNGGAATTLPPPTYGTPHQSGSGKPHKPKRPKTGGNRPTLPDAPTVSAPSTARPETANSAPLPSRPKRAASAGHGHRRSKAHVPLRQSYLDEQFQRLKTDSETFMTGIERYKNAIAECDQKIVTVNQRIAEARSAVANNGASMERLHAAAPPSTVWVRRVQVVKQHIGVKASAIDSLHFDINKLRKSRLLTGEQLSAVRAENAQVLDDLNTALQSTADAGAKRQALEHELQEARRKLDRQIKRINMECLDMDAKDDPIKTEKRLPLTVQREQEAAEREIARQKAAAAARQNAELSWSLAMQGNNLAAAAAKAAEAKRTLYELLMGTGHHNIDSMLEEFKQREEQNFHLFRELNQLCHQLEHKQAQMDERKAMVAQFLTNDDAGPPAWQQAAEARSKQLLSQYTALHAQYTKTSAELKAAYPWVRSLFHACGCDAESINAAVIPKFNSMTPGERRSSRASLSAASAAMPPPPPQTPGTPGAQSLQALVHRAQAPADAAEIVRQRTWGRRRSGARPMKGSSANLFSNSGRPVGRTEPIPGRLDVELNRNTIIAAVGAIVDRVNEFCIFHQQAHQVSRRESASTKLVELIARNLRKSKAAQHAASPRSLDPDLVPSMNSNSLVVAGRLPAPQGEQGGVTLNLPLNRDDDDDAPIRPFSVNELRRFKWAVEPSQREKELAEEKKQQIVQLQKRVDDIRAKVAQSKANAMMIAKIRAFKAQRLERLRAESQHHTASSAALEAPMFSPKGDFSMQFTLPGQSRRN